MKLSVSFVTALAAAAGFASAAPADPNAGATHIQVEKRLVPGLLPDGFIDPPKVAQHVEHIKGKYAKTLATLEANTGNNKEKRASATLPLTEEQSGSFWSGVVKIGGKSLTIDFDTGSSDALVSVRWVLCVCQ